MLKALFPDPTTLSSCEIIRLIRHRTVVPVRWLGNPGFTRKEDRLNEKDAADICHRAIGDVLDSRAYGCESAFERRQTLATIAFAKTFPCEPSWQGTPFSEIAKARDCTIGRLQLEEEGREFWRREVAAI
jgi:hypothetical protein